jgi:hypothetical protein
VLVPDHDRPAAPLPRGSITFAATVATSVGGAALCALATDLPRYVEVEPRLHSARWLGGEAPRPGARAEVAAEIPFTLAGFQRVVGPPRGIATLEEFAPPGRLVYRLDTPEAVGRLAATFSDEHAAVEGWIVPRGRAGRLALAPVSGLAGEILGRAVRRALVRATAAAAAAAAAEG